MDHAPPIDLATLALALLLMLASGGLVVALFRSRSRDRESLPRAGESGADESGYGSEPSELEFRRRQFRRRMQGSLMVGALGLLVLFGVPLTDPIWRVVHALGMLAISVWLMLLAMADWVATRHFFGCLQHAQFLDEMRLQAEVRPAAPQRLGQSDEHVG